MVGNTSPFQIWPQESRINWGVIISFRIAAPNRKTIFRSFKLAKQRSVRNTHKAKNFKESVYSKLLYITYLSCCISKYEVSNFVKKKNKKKKKSIFSKYGHPNFTSILVSSINSRLLTAFSGCLYMLCVSKQSYFSYKNEVIRYPFLPLKQSI